MRTARQTSLRTDEQYTRLLDAQSRWPLGYVMGTTQPTNPYRRAIDGQATVHVGPRQVDGFNRLLASHTRTKVRASQNRPQTELFGTAPYIALGRGHLRDIDASNEMHYGTTVTNMNLPKRVLMEQPFDRYDYIDIKPSAVDIRLGAMTRLGPQYVRPTALPAR
jgi:hypothetical protein